MSRGRWLDRASSAAIAVLLLLHLSYFFPRVVDDLFISLRYAENLAHGHGAIYNVGERVEGYSSPAWMFLQSCAITLGLEPITFGKLVGAGCLFATAWGVRAVAREMYGVGDLVSFLPPFTIAANSYLVDWTVLGLETPLHNAALVLTPLAVHRALAKPSRKANAIAASALVVLGTSRPESPLYLVLIVLSAVAFERSRERIVALARFVLPAAIVLSGLLLLRRAYYGDWFPNTYHVKGAHAAFGLAKLADLYRHGSQPTETFLYGIGTAGLLYFSWKKRVLAPALSLLACLYFTASVEVDWMPNLRHLLPVTVLAPMGIACIVEELGRRKMPSPQWSAVVVVVVACFQIARVDSRLSTIEHRDHWVTPKSLEKWAVTMEAYRRIEPEHITKMGPWALGQISQCWPVLETSKEPVEESWWAGRDIGAVGYLTGVKVFDTAGLVTAEVGRSEAWTARGEVTPELIGAMFAKRPVSADIFNGWDSAAGEQPVSMARYRVIAGTRELPNAIVAFDRVPPSHDEILRRYRALAAKLPHLYHLHTLYGEAVGAAVEKRLRVIENAEPAQGVSN